jgi:hypothetical protein
MLFDRELEMGLRIMDLEGERIGPKFVLKGL